MHARKLAEVRAWLQAFGKPPPPRGASAITMQNAVHGKDAFYGHGQSMMILTGPAGCAKTAMVSHTGILPACVF